MSGTDELDDTRTAVKTYIPAYQKEVWEKHAKNLDMTRSEFVRSMVQAGRKEFEVEQPDTHSEGATPRGGGLETGVLETLPTDDYLSWDELVKRLAGDFEDELEETLQQLMSEQRVQYSGRHGGYTAVSE